MMCIVSIWAGAFHQPPFRGLVDLAKLLRFLCLFRVAKPHPSLVLHHWVFTPNSISTHFFSTGDAQTNVNCSPQYTVSLSRPSKPLFLLAFGQCTNPYEVRKLMLSQNAFN